MITKIQKTYPPNILSITGVFTRNGSRSKGRYAKIQWAGSTVARLLGKREYRAGCHIVHKVRAGYPLEHGRWDEDNVKQPPDYYGVRVR